MKDIQINKDKVLAALWGRLNRDELETDPKNLILAISKQTGVQLTECRTIILGVAGSAILLAKATTNKEQEMVK